MLCWVCAALLLVAGCSCSTSGTSTGAGSSEASAPVGKSMAGPAQKVIISRQALENRPKPWALTTPESAIRSYLLWTSYAYRIAQSEVATPTMSAAQEVRVDSYLQLNLEKSKIIDQALDSITLGKPSVGSTSTLIPAKEHWTYRYISINKVGQTVGGPYKASYDTTYTVVKNKKGDWVVDSVKVKALGAVK
jgi:hypothetical protein